MYKKGATIGFGKLVVALVAVILVGGGALIYANNQGWLGGSGSGGVQLQFGGSQQTQDGQPGGFAAGTCPTTGATTATFDLKNGEDTTSDTTFDASGYLFGSKGGYNSITDTTAGTASINCGETYTLKLVSADGNNADNARITAIEQGPGAVLNADGSVTFTPDSATYYLKVVGSKHGVPEFRVWSVDNGAYRYSAASSNSNSWQLTGFIWNGTTSENSSITVNSGQSFTDEIHFRANQSDTNGADFGYWVLVDAGAAKWNEPTIRLDGIVLTNQKGLMNSDENRQYGSTYEYAYKVDASITDSERVLRTEFKALSGVNPAYADSPVVAIVPIGAYKATASNAVKIAAAKDDSSATSVFTSQSLTLAIA